MKPDQLSAVPSAEDRRDTVLKKLALQSHLEARQLEDVKRDLAQRVKKSDGPFTTGERVFVWIQDPSRKKDLGKWLRGRVLSQTGPMVMVDMFSEVRTVNESNLRRNHDEWHDSPLPERLENPSYQELQVPGYQDQPAQGKPDSSTPAQDAGTASVGARGSSPAREAVPAPAGGPGGSSSSSSAMFNSVDPCIFWSTLDEVDFMEVTWTQPQLSFVLAHKRT